MAGIKFVGSTKVQKLRASRERKLQQAQQKLALIAKDGDHSEVSKGGNLPQETLLVKEENEILQKELGELKKVRKHLFEQTQVASGKTTVKKKLRTSSSDGRSDNISSSAKTKETKKKKRRDSKSAEITAASDGVAGIVDSLPHSDETTLKKKKKKKSGDASIASVKEKDPRGTRKTKKKKSAGDKDDDIEKAATGTKDKKSRSSDASVGSIGTKKKKVRSSDASVGTIGAKPRKSRSSDASVGTASVVATGTKTMKSRSSNASVGNTAKKKISKSSDASVGTTGTKTKKSRSSSASVGAPGTKTKKSRSSDASVVTKETRVKKSRSSDASVGTTGTKTKKSRSSNASVGSSGIKKKKSRSSAASVGTTGTKKKKSRSSDASVGTSGTKKKKSRSSDASVGTTGTKKRKKKIIVSSGDSVTSELSMGSYDKTPGKVEKSERRRRKKGTAPQLENALSRLINNEPSSAGPQTEKDEHEFSKHESVPSITGGKRNLVESQDIFVEAVENDPSDSSNSNLDNSFRPAPSSNLDELPTVPAERVQDEASATYPFPSPKEVTEVFSKRESVPDTSGKRNLVESHETMVETVEGDFSESSSNSVLVSSFRPLELQTFSTESLQDEASSSSSEEVMEGKPPVEPSLPEETIRDQLPIEPPSGVAGTAGYGIEKKDESSAAYPFPSPKEVTEVISKDESVPVSSGKRSLVESQEIMVETVEGDFSESSSNSVLVSSFRPLELQTFSTESLRDEASSSSSEDVTKAKPPGEPLVPEETIRDQHPIEPLSEVAGTTAYGMDKHDENCDSSHSSDTHTSMGNRNSLRLVGDTSSSLAHAAREKSPIHGLGNTNDGLAKGITEKALSGVAIETIGVVAQNIKKEAHFPAADGVLPDDQKRIVTEADREKAKEMWGLVKLYVKTRAAFDMMNSLRDKASFLLDSANDEHLESVEPERLKRIRAVEKQKLDELLEELVQQEERVSAQRMELQEESENLSKERESLELRIANLKHESELMAMRLKEAEFKLEDIKDEEYDGESAIQLLELQEENAELKQRSATYASFVRKLYHDQLPRQEQEKMAMLELLEEEEASSAAEFGGDEESEESEEADVELPGVRLRGEVLVAAANLKEQNSVIEQNRLEIARLKAEFRRVRHENTQQRTVEEIEEVQEEIKEIHIRALTEKEALLNSILKEEESILSLEVELEQRKSNQQGFWGWITGQQHETTDDEEDDDDENVEKEDDKEDTANTALETDHDTVTVSASLFGENSLHFKGDEMMRKMFREELRL
eukprot:scaffold1284_cov108-Cylindrotheca_fusiformis.AAC.24